LLESQLVVGFESADRCGRSTAVNSVNGPQAVSKIRQRLLDLLD
jgi:hypothetical protein